MITPLDYINVEELRSRIMKYRDDSFEMTHTGITAKDFKIMNEVVFGVLMIMADIQEKKSAIKKASS